MIKKVNETCKSFNDALGITVTLPEPKKETLKATSALGYVAGAGLITAGVIFSSKVCAVLGGISIISGIIQGRESKK